MEGPERAARPERAVGPEDKRLRTLDSAEEDDHRGALSGTGYLAAVYRRPFDSRPGWARDDRGWEARPTVLEAAQRRLAFALSLAASRPPAQRKPRATAPVEMLVADVVEMVGRGVVGLDYPASPPSVQALVSASRANDKRELAAQIAAGADVDGADADGWTALVWAADNDDGDACVEVLVNAGAQLDLPNRKGWTALMSAVSEGKTSIVQQLLSGGADVNIANADGYTAIDYAKARHPECLRVLEEFEGRPQERAANASHQ